MSLSNLLFMAGGTAIGIIIGCLPGLSAAMGVALLLPMTFTMEMCIRDSTTPMSMILMVWRDRKVVPVAVAPTLTPRKMVTMLMSSF